MTLAASNTLVWLAVAGFAPLACDHPAPCVPECSGIACGSDDGCGGSCAIATGCDDPGAVSHSPFAIYLAPDGDDGRSGLDPASSILTLERAQALVSAYFPSGLTNDVEVRIASGRYFHQYVTWTVTSPLYSITFLPLDASAPAPVFDGCSKLDPDPGVDCREPNTSDTGGHLFMLGSEGSVTNIRLEGLELTHYRNGIRFAGSADLGPAGANGRNRIDHCYFHDIGNAWGPAAYTLATDSSGKIAILPGYGAVRTINSDDDEFTFNKFENIANVDDSLLIPNDPRNVYSCKVCMHAFYLANGSDRARVANNEIHHVTGSAIRIRHDCLGTLVEDNAITDGGYFAAISEYDATGECMCWNTVVRGNLVSGAPGCTAAEPVWATATSGATSDCNGEQPPAGAVSASVSGNCDVEAAPYCEDFAGCVTD